MSKEIPATNDYLEIPHRKLNLAPVTSLVQQYPIFQILQLLNLVKLPSETRKKLQQ